MRSFVLVVPVLALACGGSVASIPSTSSEPPAAPTPPAAPPFAPPPPVIAPPAPTATACDTSGPEKALDSVATMTRAIQNAWDACGDHPICPADAPHLYFAQGPSAFAACGPWCGGDGGFCATNDPAYRFTYAVTSTASGYVLELTNASATRRFGIRWFATEPMASMTLTDQDAATITALQMVGIPVK